MGLCRAGAGRRVARRASELYPVPLSGSTGCGLGRVIFVGERRGPSRAGAVFKTSLAICSDPLGRAYTPAKSLHSSQPNTLVLVRIII